MNDVFYLSFVRPSVRPSVCYQYSEHDSLKTDETVLLQIGINGLCGKDL